MRQFISDYVLVVNKLINHSYSTVIALSDIDLTLCKGVVLLDLTYCFIAIQNFFPPIPSRHLKISYFKYTMNYIHRLLTYLDFTQTKHSFIKNAVVNKSFECLRSKNLLHIVQKNCLWGSHGAHSKRTCSTDSLHAPQLGHSWDQPLLACLPNSSKNPWVPEWNFKKTA